MTVEHGLAGAVPGFHVAGPRAESGHGGGPAIRPGLFCQFLLKAQEAAESQTRRRKRDQSPDRVGLAVKRDLLRQVVEADPAPEAFEGWLMERIFQAPHAGSVRAMCEQIFLEYRMAAHQPELAAWLASGAPSDDAEPEGPRRERDRAEGPGRWRDADDSRIACTCHLPHR